MGHFKRITLLIPVLLLFFLASESEAADGVRVDFTLLFGPAPETIADTQGKYMWVIPQIENNSSEAQSVTVSLEVTGAPLGCDQDVALILPGFDSFWMAPGEEKFVLYRVRYECHPPAYPELFPLDMNFCVSGSFGSDCDSKIRYLIIHTPAVEWSDAASDVKTTWFTLCPEVGFCLPPWPIDWRGFSLDRIGFLGGAPNAIYLHWFQHGIKIWEYFDSDRPFDLVWNWKTWLSYIPFYGAGWRDEEGMNQYTTSYIPGCNEAWYPGLSDCTQGDVGYTYIDPQFHGYAGLWCEGPIGWNCLGSDRVDYYYPY